MKLTVPSAEVLITGYNIHYQIVFLHVTTDEHVHVNQWYEHRNAPWTNTDG